MFSGFLYSINCVTFWCYSKMMQLDGTASWQVFSEHLFGKVEATVIKITSWNHIDQCKQKLQIGIRLINDNMFAYVSFLS